MKTMIQKLPLKGCVILVSMRARSAFLALLVGMLTASMFELQPAGAAQANITQDARQQSITRQVHSLDTVAIRLETFVVSNNSVYYRYSDNDGGTWSAWSNLGNPAAGFQITSPVSVVTDGANGHLQIFVMGQDSHPGLSVYRKVLDPQQLSDWQFWESAAAGFPPGGGGASISDAERFVSRPVFTSWGSGRLDEFAIVADNDGNRGLAHIWVDNGERAQYWEILGTGTMQGDPAAVSWGSGRIDVFVRGGGNELDHKSFANGSWSSGWENLGGTLTASPAAMSWMSGFVGVFTRNENNGLGENLYGQGFWSGWGSGVDSNSISSGPAATSTGPNSIHVFALGPNGNLLHRRSSNGSWTNWEDLGTPLGSALSLDPAAIVWHPIIPTPAPTPTPRPQPTPTRIICRQPPCHSTP
jgi:hypothetical protein